MECTAILQMDTIGRQRWNGWLQGKGLGDVEDVITGFSALFKN